MQDQPARPSVSAGTLFQDFERIDKILDKGDSADLEDCLSELQDRYTKSPNDPHILWRIAKAYERLFVKTQNQEYLNKGIEVSETALALKTDLGNVHKWYAILIGERSQFQSVKNKIQSGRLFKEHVDKAVALNPKDPVLHFLLGRFAFDVSELKWYERKVATALFSEPPSATVEEALGHFLEAAKHSQKEWKMNMLYIAKCHMKLGHKKEGMEILRRAQRLDSTPSDEEADLEINKLRRRSRFSVANLTDKFKKSASVNRFGDLQ